MRTYPDGHTEICFTPVAPFDTAETLDWFSEVYGQPIGQGSRPLLVISLFVYDFLSRHPFNDGNARMSRLLTEFLLYKICIV